MTPWLRPGPERTRRPEALVVTRVPAVKVGIASGPGVGAGVALAGGSDVEGATLASPDAAALADGEALGFPSRHPPSRIVRGRSRSGAGRLMQAA
jgi:hypothetical protein